MEDLTKIVSQAEAAKLWKVSRAYISQLVTSGKLNHVVVGGRKFVVMDNKFLNFKK